MIGISVLIVFLLWLAVAVWLSWRIPQWLGVIRHTKSLSVILFPVVLVLPVADELIGRWQFNRLCEKEAVVWLSPEWQTVKRAERRIMPSRNFDGYFIPIDSGGGEYADIDTGKVFMTSTSLFTKGGYLTRHVFGFGGFASCHPINIQTINQQVNISELLKNGETKL